MKKIGIVSSFSDTCGNASYTRALAAGLFRRGYEVKIFDLRQDLMQGRGRYLKRLGDNLISEITEEVKQCDAVNIQWEYGLFGCTHSDIKNRILKLLKHLNKNLSVTLHRVDTYCDVKEPLKKLVRGRVVNALRGFKEQYHLYRRIGLTGEILAQISEKKGKAIVHSNKDYYSALSFGCNDKSDIIVHPLCFYEHHTRNENDLSVKRSLLERYRLSNDSIIIGLFGFITKYKNYETALRALALLPDIYKIIIVGGQHPVGIATEPNGADYIRKLNGLIRSLNLWGRVIYCGVPETDDEMVSYIRLCDHVVLPYNEVGQGGSGIAAVALENNLNVHLARNYCFLELKKFFNDSFKMFDISNEVELMQNIISLEQSPATVQPEWSYNIETNINTYLISMRLTDDKEKS